MIGTYMLKSTFGKEMRGDMGREYSYEKEKHLKF